MNQRTAQWLRDIKITPAHINEAQLKNGYLFGLVFERLNLMKDKKFKNSQDLACVFQNFKNTKDLLYDHFGIAFPANQIIYRSSQLMEKLREACEEYQINKKQLKLTEIKKKYLNTTNNNATVGQQKLLSMRQNQIKQQAFGSNTMSSANRTFSSQEPKLPPKILQIQKKLTKFRDEQTRHELLTLQTRKQQLDSMNQAIQDHRYFEMSKLKMNQEMRKEFEKKVADVVTKTNEVKLQRIDKQQQFFRFMKSKKDNFLNSLRQEEQQAFVQGLDDFQLNCLRQGIELQHDPNKSYQPKEQNFNSKVMLERIKDNIKKLQRERKQRQKRTNSKYVETQEANVKSQKVWQQNYVLERMQKSMASHQKYLKDTEKRMRFEETEKQEITLKLSKKTVKPLPQARQEQRQEFESQLRANRLIFYDKQIQRLEKKDKALKEIAKQTLQALLYTVIVAEEEETNFNFTYSEWKSLEQTFVEYEIPEDEKRKKEESEFEAKQPKENQAFFGYLTELRQVEVQKKGQIASEQRQIAELIDDLIEQAYPKKDQPQPQDLPLYMPLRIGLSGNRLSGKTTQIKKLMAKYPSIVLIDPKKILTEAIQLARPPPQNEDPKKKKQSKKPEDETPEKLQLKKFGQELLVQLKNDSSQQNQPTFEYESADFKYVVSAIRWKLKQSFKNLSHEQILAKYNQSLEQQNQRLKDFEKNQEEKNKKKDSKKPATQVVTELPVFNEFFYTEGFVLDNIEFNETNLRTIERELNGFVRTEERLNEEAERLREELGQILPIKKSQIPNNLNNGFFNVLINIDASPQVQTQRNQGRKMDPTTGQVYHPKFNPHPTDIKGLAERLIEVKKVDPQSPESAYQTRQKRQIYYKVFGYDDKKVFAYRDLSEVPMEEANGLVVKAVEETLKVQYEHIKGYEKEQKPSENELIQEQGGVEKQVNQQPQKSQSQPKVESPLIGLSQKSLSVLLSKQLALKESYAQSIAEQLSQLPSIRHSFEQALVQHQRQFLEIITRPDDKANRILTFQDNYNKLLEEKSNIINDRTAINHLVAKLDELYDSLWVSIEGKKNQAIDRRKFLIASPWINSEVEKVVEVGKNILQTELDYLVDMLAFIIVVQLHLQGKNSDPIIDHLCLGTFINQFKGIPKESEPIESIISAQSKVSSRLQFYIDQTNQCLQTLPQWYQKKQTQSKIKISPELKKLAQVCIAKQKERISVTVEYLKELVYSYSEEQMCYFRALVNKMDDWIISGIKDENQFTYSIYKDLKSSIERINRSQLKDLFPTPISASIKPIERLTNFHQPIPFSNNHADQIDYSSFKIFLEQLKCYCFSVNSTQSSSSEVLKINFTRFRDYFTKRKKSNLLNQIYLKLDFDTMQQYLVTQNEASFKEVALAMILWDLNVLDEESLNKYEQQISSQNSEKALLNSPEQLSVAPFVTGMKIQSRKQISSLQHLIYDIMQNEYTHQVSVKEYIEILGSFSSLQLLRYGDSLMMLDQQEHK